MRILITGGAGFVGSNLAILMKAHRSNDSIVALDNLRRSGSELNVPRLRSHGIEFLHGDVRNPEDLDGAGKVDVVIDCAAEPSVLAGRGESPQYLIDTNLRGTINTLELCRRQGAGMVLLSTSRVYPVAPLNAVPWEEAPTRYEWTGGGRGAGPGGVGEDFPLSGSRSLYGATKLASELILAEYAEMYDIPAVVNRCGVIAGPWQMGKIDQGVLVYWVARHHFGGRLRYLGWGGSGKQVRDILHVGDLCRLLELQLDRLEGYRGETFNVGGGREISFSLLELTDLCREATGRKIEVVAGDEERPGDLRVYLSDCSAVRAATGWAAVTPVKEIVEDVSRWIASHERELAAILK